MVTYHPSGSAKSGLSLGVFPSRALGVSLVVLSLSGQRGGHRIPSIFKFWLFAATYGLPSPPLPGGPHAPYFLQLQKLLTVLHNCLLTASLPHRIQPLKIGQKGVFVISVPPVLGTIDVFWINEWLNAGMS